MVTKQWSSWRGAGEDGDDRGRGCLPELDLFSSPLSSCRLPKAGRGAGKNQWSGIPGLCLGTELRGFVLGPIPRPLTVWGGCPGYLPALHCLAPSQIPSTNSMCCLDAWKRKVLQQP